MPEPLISCVMLTYGRRRNNVDGTQLIEEAVESFLRQDYRNKELILLNDAPQQKIIYEHPLVRVINHPHRFKTLGDKRNYSVAMAKGEFIACWDDDDISTSNRLSDSFEALKSKNVDYISAKHYFYSTKNKFYSLIRRPHDGLFGTFLADAAVLHAVPYRSMNSGQDVQLVHDLRKKRYSIAEYAEDPQDLSYVYRWGFLARHISGLDKRTGYDQMGREDLPECEIRLRPRWRKPYDRIVQDLLLDHVSAAS